MIDTWRIKPEAKTLAALLLATLHAASAELIAIGEARFVQTVRMAERPVPVPALFHEL